MGSVLTFDPKRCVIGEEDWKRASMIQFPSAGLPPGENDCSSNSRRGPPTQSFGRLRPTSLENHLDPNHREKSPHTDYRGSSSDKSPLVLNSQLTRHRQVLSEEAICVNSEDWPIFSSFVYLPIYH